MEKIKKLTKWQKIDNINKNGANIRNLKINGKKKTKTGEIAPKPEN